MNLFCVIFFEVYEMKNYQPSALAESEDQQQKWEKPFQELLDEIYWTGYTDQMLEDRPQHYQDEFKSFISMYDHRTRNS